MYYLTIWTGPCCRLGERLRRHDDHHPCGRADCSGQTVRHLLHHRDPPAKEVACLRKPCWDRVQLLNRPHRCLGFWGFGITRTLPDAIDAIDGTHLDPAQGPAQPFRVSGPVAGVSSAARPAPTSNPAMPMSRFSLRDRCPRLLSSRCS